MKIYKKLTEKEAYALPENQLVYVTSDIFSMNRMPALVQRSPFPDCIKVVTSEPASFILDRHVHTSAEYGKGWFIEVEDGFTVETPDGTLHVYDKGNTEYPGVMVDLYPAHAQKEDVVGLTMVEYIPGGEGVCSYMLGSLDAMREEFNEVPPDRMVHKDGTPVSLEEYNNVPLCKAATTEYHVTSGLVTRAWPDETHDEENHRRVFHHGYNNLS